MSSCSFTSGQGRLQLDADNTTTLPGLVTADSGAVVVSATGKINDAVVNVATMLVSGTASDLSSTILPECEQSQRCGHCQASCQGAES